MAKHTVSRLLVVSCWMIGCLGAEAPVTTEQELRVVCTAPGAVVPSGALRCGQAFTAECGAPPREIYVQSASCGAVALSVSDSLARAPGTYEVVVRDGAATFCASTVEVVDRTPPAVVGRTIALWPPNHREVAVRAADCVEVRDACDPAPEVWFTDGTVDEADDDRGDGHTSGDLRFDACGVARVVAERSGGGDGRVYELGVRVRDRGGNVVDTRCRVVVPHDQSGRPAVQGGPVVSVSAPSCR